MKKFTKDELQEKANKTYFAKAGDFPAMIATSDGNFFYPDAANHAKAHAGRQHEIFILPRPSSSGSSTSGSTAPKQYAKNAATVIKEIKEAGDKVTLEQVGVANDIANDERKSVSEAYAKAMAAFADGDTTEKGTTTTGAKTPPTKDELLTLIANVADEKALDALDAEHNLSKSEDEDLKKAFEEKENTFL